MNRILLLLFLFLLPGFFSRHSGLNAGNYPWKANSVLNSGRWIKVRTPGRGIYKIPYDKLKTWGFNTPELVNVYGSGGIKLPESLDMDPVDDLVKNPAWRGKDGTGKDCLFFYSTGSVGWKWDPVFKIFRHTTNPYSEVSCYFLSDEGNAPFSVAKREQSGQSATHTVNSFDDYALLENEKYSLIQSGQQWFGEKYATGTSHTYSFSSTNPVQGEMASLTLNCAGRSSQASFFDVTVNQVKQSSVSFNPVNVDDATSLYADEKQKTYLLPLTSGKLDVSLAYSATNNLSEAWIDYLVLNWRRTLMLSGDQLIFRDSRSVGEGNIAQFIIENGGGAMVLDITKPDSLFEVSATSQGTQLAFRRPSGELREYLVFRSSGNFPEPELAGEVPDQNLHSLEVPELLIITHPDFLTSANTVAAFHSENDQMEVAVVTVAQVCNEFGSGIPDATAIRNFIRMCYDKSRKLKYVLLFGDGCYDNRNLTGAGKAFIPTYQSETSLSPTSTFVSDDYFVILDPGESIYNGTMDLGIGRLPVSSAYEAAIVTEKILNYHSSEAMGIWRTNLCFIADDEDGNLHVSDSETLANQLNDKHREFNTEKIYFDSYRQETNAGAERYPGVMEAINRQVEKGVLILNYMGHANTRFMADERVLDVSTINTWTNSNNLPIFVTATCEFSRFDAAETSAGEYILFNPNGGGIGLFSTTRMVYAYSNFLLSKSFYQYAFEKDNEGMNFRMGDIMRLAKISTVNSVNNRNFTLLADPALRLSYPRYKVVTKTINQKIPAVVPDTLNALDKVTVAGEITDKAGVKLTSFNGYITAVVYDKAIVQKTLGNPGNTPFYYKSQNNIIYKGEASVSNGEFSFSFVIPRDISYSLGKGKILYYARNGQEDAHGAFEDFIIGGSSSSQIPDDQGPVVDLYLDDPSFKNGGQTSRNPLLIADISDENSINTVGTGVGHDITAILDDDYSTLMVLNDYYKAVRDDYRKGRIEYPLRNLREGEHTLRLKVWDTANNSTEAEIDFVVSGDLFIREVSNYPNPVTGSTSFVFSHNQPDGRFDTQVEIFDMRGSLVDKYTTYVTSRGTGSNPLMWNLRERGISLTGGIYMYRITIRSDEGRLASKTGKMVICR